MTISNSQNHHNKKSQSGFSLIELVIATGMMGVLVVGSMSAINSVMTVNIASQQLHEYQNNHYLNLVKIQNEKFARRLLNLNVANPDPALLDCFASKSSNCKKFAKKDNVPDDDRLIQCVAGAQNCIYKTTATYELKCSPNACTSIDFKLTTEDLNPDINKRRQPKITTVSLPGILFAPKKSINYACASAGDLITSINYDSNVASCTPLLQPQQAMCAIDEQPLKDVGSAGAARCEPLEVISCESTGIGEVGIFKGDSKCTVMVMPPENPPPPPPPPPPVIQVAVMPTSSNLNAFLQKSSGKDECWVLPNYPLCEGKYRVSKNANINECLRNSGKQIETAGGRPQEVIAPNKGQVKAGGVIAGPCGLGNVRPIEYEINVSPYVEIQDCKNAVGGCAPGAAPACGNLFASCGQGSSCQGGGKLYLCAP